MKLKAYSVSRKWISETNLLTSGASGRDNYYCHAQGCGSDPGSMLEWIWKLIPLLKIDPDLDSAVIYQTGSDLNIFIPLKTLNLNSSCLAMRFFIIYHVSFPIPKDLDPDPRLVKFQIELGFGSFY